MSTTEPGVCAHCGLPLAGAVSPAVTAPDDPAFCCHGCAAAYALLHDLGLERYYALGERRRSPVEPSGRSFAELDHPAFHDLHVRRRRDGLEETDLHLEGVTCASCVWLVESATSAVPGLVEARLDAPRSIVHVTWDPSRTGLSAIAAFLDGLGYRPRPFRGRQAEALRRAEERAAWVRIGVAGALAGNVMMIATALYAGWFGGMSHEDVQYFRWLSLALTAPAVFGPGRVFFKSAWAAARRRTFHMDQPIALALLAGFARGASNTIAGSGPIYFDGVAMLVFLLLVGRFLQLRAQRAATDATGALWGLAPSVARVVTLDGTQGETLREVPSEALTPGMMVEVRAGETIPADGIVLSGNSSLDASLLTGESHPVVVARGDGVFAGTVNLSARIRVAVERSGEESRLGRLLGEVGRGAARRAPIVHAADRVAAGFVGVVLVLAAVTFVLWWRWDPARALDSAIAMLIVTCPCALALATPLAVAVAIGRAARAGILIKGGDALERLARPGRMWLDKTGTLTEGRFAVVGAQGADEAFLAAAALERHVRHPIADALIARARELGAGAPAADATDATEVRVEPGRGIAGIVGGRTVVVGSPSFVRSRLEAAGASPAPEEDAHAPGASLTPVWIALDGRLAARAALGDRVRPEAPGAVRALLARGWDVRILSGDSPAIASEVAWRVGLDPARARGGATPEDKLAAVEEAERSGPVVMVGDGVNDAAAIARAGVGVGMRGGAEACLDASDVFLARPGLGPLVELVDGASRTMRLIRRSIALSLVYNVAAAGLALAGRMDPLVAAILMPVSSLTVVLASVLARTFDPAPAESAATAASAQTVAQGVPASAELQASAPAPLTAIAEAR